MPDHSKPAAIAPWLRVPAVRRFVHRYGWRAYSIPFLTMLTALALARPVASGAADASSIVASIAGASDGAAVSITPRLAVTSPAAPIRIPAPAYAAAPRQQVTICDHNTQPKLVVISVSHQHAWMCSGHQLVQQSAVTTGETDNGDETPVGTWAVYSRETARTLTGPGYTDYVQYWVPFNGDFGFHDASWQTMPFGSQDYHTHGSHGCVHLPTSVMAWLYQWIDVGAAVTVMT